MNKTDIHCHLLFGVDDGAAGIRESLELLRMEEEDGVDNIIITPHLRHHMFESSDEEIKKRFAQLNTEKENAGISIKLSLSREYHFDQSLVDALKEKKVLFMKDRTLLVEFSHDTPFSQMDNAVTQLCRLGIRPVIAHIERYEVIQKEDRLAAELAGKGALIQVNSGSILGEEGGRQKKTVKSLIKQDLIFAIASDSHDLMMRRPNLASCEKYLIKKYGMDYAKKVLHDNPTQLVP